MSRTATRLLVFLLLLVTTFAVATAFQPRAESWKRGGDSASVLNVLLGDSRRLFANHIFTKADVYFHSGYYPSIFDQSSAPKDSRHMTSEEGSPEEEDHEKKMNFLHTPKDWIERFGRHFMITEHTHLEGGTEREILPWLKLSAELDPQRIDTYTVAAFWLRDHLNKPLEAEEFLRDGLRHNPNSYEILFELGCVYNENLQDPARARRVWELSLRRWREQEPNKKVPDLIGLEKILIRLARLEENTGHLEQAITYLEQAAERSPSAALLRQQIDDLKLKLAQGSATNVSKLSPNP
jgi:tetratricopeptide (TPR) repeat protein